MPGLGNYDGTRIRWTCDDDHEIRRPVEDNSEGNNNNNGNDSSRNNNNNSNTTTTTPIVTTFLNFESQRAVLFNIEFPNGAENTSLALLNDTGNDRDTATLATFPSFVAIGDRDRTEKKNHQRSSNHWWFPPAFPSALSWEGSFVQSVRRLSVGPQGGPTVFYDASDPGLKNVVVASPFFDSISSGTGKTALCTQQQQQQQQNQQQAHHRCHQTTSFNDFTAGNNKDWTGALSAFSPGMSGRLKKIRPGGSQSILLYQGSRGGITATMKEWGNILQTFASSAPKDVSSNNSTRITSSNNHSKPGAVSSEKPPSSITTTAGRKNRKIRDVTLEKIGYQTDNGAMYCFCGQSNCSEVLLREKEYLDSIGIPIGYLSFQGAGTSSGRGKAAPWCIERWSADGGQDRKKYPLDIGAFRDALGVPLQLYAPYFCPETNGYFFPHTPWKSVRSNPELPGCSGFDFETVRASDSRDFFDWFLQKGIDGGGMASFESDFMNQNANCVENFVENSNGADEFLAGMAGAALDRKVPIQWCYASPNVVFSTLEFPAVTNVRVSFDFCYGRSYDIGESSLLVWALGLAPSKDTLWTTDNKKTETPGCEWTVDHESAAAELHVVLALMSTGPVGISDAIGMTNATLLRRTISADGSLLQPSKPITAVDSTFLENSRLDGYLYGTHGLGLSWIFVSYQLRAPYPVTLRDFWPPMKPIEPLPLAAAAVSGFVRGAATTRLVYRRFASSPDCIDGTNAIESGCVEFVSLVTQGDLAVDDSSPIFVASPSSFDSPGSDLSPEVVTVWQECHESGVFFLGELDKYVALSPKRFLSLVCTEQGVSVGINGSKGEVVEVTMLVPRANNKQYEVVTKTITIRENHGLERFDFLEPILVSKKGRRIIGDRW